MKAVDPWCESVIEAGSGRLADGPWRGGVDFSYGITYRGREDNEISEVEGPRVYQRWWSSGQPRHRRTSPRRDCGEVAGGTTAARCCFCLVRNGLQDSVVPPEDSVSCWNVAGFAVSYMA